MLASNGAVAFVRVDVTLTAVREERRRGMVTVRKGRERGIWMSMVKECSRCEGIFCVDGRLMCKDDLLEAELWYNTGDLEPGTDPRHIG